MPALFNRRVITFGISMLPVSVRAIAQMAKDPRTEWKSAPNGTPGLTHGADAIHQEVMFEASAERVYDALLDEKQFTALTRLSAAKAVLAAKGASETKISSLVGGAFTLFGGVITGHQLVLVENEQIVQAWHDSSWSSTEYSIASFALAPIGVGTRLTFNHRGFPDGSGPHLSQGWYLNYWEPLTKLLAGKAD